MNENTAPVPIPTERQSLTFTVYPANGSPQSWSLNAYIFGEWAVHEPHPAEFCPLPWVVSHAPTGACAFYAKEKAVAIETAQRLAGIEAPTVNVVGDESGQMPKVGPLSAEWVDRVAEKLIDLDIWAYAGQFIRPDELPEHVAKAKAEREGENDG